MTPTRVMRAVVALLIMAAAPGFAVNTKGSIPVFFFRNSAGANSSLRFIAETPEMRVGFQRDSVVFQIHGRNMTLRFVGADARVQIEGDEPISGKANFLIGQSADRWETGVELYHRVVYRGLYPGIDLRYAGTEANIKSEFVVAPGVDPSLIRLAYPTAEGLKIDSNGDLEVSGAGAELREYAPVIFQDSPDGSRIRIDGRYRLLGHRTVGFEIGAYDASKPLIIDPVVSYSTYLGGSLTGSVTGAAADSSGNLYVTGWTEALDFPVSGSIQSTNHGGVDAFVAKLSPSGTLVYATYIGGNGDDRGAAIALDSSGQVYVTGSTASTNFPLAAAIRSTLGGGLNAFALKLNAAGSALVYSTYLGGTVWDQGTTIAADGLGNAYIAGDTKSANFPFSTPAQATFGGQTDAFVTKLTPTGAITFSTFLGGSGDEHAGGIAVDASGDV